jgi:hypothetical protein
MKGTRAITILLTFLTAGVLAAARVPAQQLGTVTMVGVQDLSWSADGQKLFFSAMRVRRDYSDYTPDKWAIYRYELASKQLRQVVASSFSVSASPESSRIAVGMLENKNRDIWLLDEDGRQLVRLTTDPAEEFGPAWSPDERQVAFTSKRDGHAEIYVVNADGTAERRLTQNTADRSLNPSWSPDARQIAFYLEKGDGRDQIIVIGVDGSNPINVTNDSFNNVYPGWTPDGRVMYGQSLKGTPAPKVFVVDRDGRNKQALLNLESFYARYSPDGSKIAYIAMAPAEGMRLEIVNRTGAAVATVTLGSVGSDADRETLEPFRVALHRSVQQPWPRTDVRGYLHRGRAIFLAVLLVVLAGAAIHIAVEKERTIRRAAELYLLWILVGYCGVATLGHSVVSLTLPLLIAKHHGFPASTPYQQFASVVLLAMSVASLLTLRYRGRYVIGPAVSWAVFFAGATFVHLNDGGAGGITHGGVMMIFATHGLIAFLLGAALLASGVLSGEPGWPDHGG